MESVKSYAKEGYEKDVFNIHYEYYLRYYDEDFNPRLPNGLTLYDQVLINGERRPESILEIRYKSAYGLSYPSPSDIIEKVINRKEMAYRLGFLEIEVEVRAIKGYAALVEYVIEKESYIQTKFYDPNSGLSLFPCEELHKKMSTAMAKEKDNREELKKEFELTNLRGTSRINEHNYKEEINKIDRTKVNKIAYSVFTKAKEWVWISKLREAGDNSVLYCTLDEYIK